MTASIELNLNVSINLRSYINSKNIECRGVIGHGPQVVQMA